MSGTLLVPASNWAYGGSNHALLSENFSLVFDRDDCGFSDRLFTLVVALLYCAVSVINIWLDFS